MNQPAGRIWRAFVLLAVAVPFGWSMYAADCLCQRDLTSSVNLVAFFECRPRLASMAFGGIVLLILERAFPIPRAWILPILAVGACLGHCFWSLS